MNFKQALKIKMFYFSSSDQQSPSKVQLIGYKPYSANYRMSPMDFLNRINGEGQTIKHSILEHLSLLLNTRQGSLAHMPDYGLPEYNVRSFDSHAHQVFLMDIKALIEKFEPRIEALGIEKVQGDTTNGVLQVTLNARLLQGEGILVDALLLGDGSVKVSSTQ